MNRARSICLIINGKSAERNDVRAAVRVLRDEGHSVGVQVTWEAGDASRFARQAAEAGYAVVVAGGGDGTINEVVAGLGDAAKEEKPLPALGILPLGTANDLARACNIPLDPFAALRLAVSADPIEVDVGQANGRWFVNVATGGFGTQVTTATPPGLKRILGGAAYLVTGLTQFSSIRPERGKLTGPGLNWEGEFLVLAVGNGRQAGGGHQVCPEALINDGLFDVRLVPHLPNEEIQESLRALLSEGMNAIRRKLVSARVPWLEIESDETIQINLDGEPIASKQFRFEILPRRLKLILSPESPLLGK